MSGVDKIKEIIQNNIDSEVSPIDLIKKDIPRVSEEESSRRYGICKSCPELIKLTKQCKKCGCFMKAKVTLERAICPIGKW